ncbi:MAG: winged helix-turn-helix domain-containing protein, partial [Pseudomonadota bacterium]
MELRQGFALGSLRVLPIEGRVISEQGEVRVQPKSMDVLVALARGAGTVVERDALLESVWGERAVSDEPWTRCIGELRRALGDRARSPVFIETVPKRGYRLLVQPGPLSDGPTADDPPMTGAGKAASAAAPDTRRHAAIAGILCLVFLASVWAYLGRAPSAPSSEVTAPAATVSADRSLAILPLRNVSGDPQQNYLGESLAAELTAVLARNPALRVASQLSSARYRSLGGAPEQIAAALGVAHLVEGTARIAGDRVAVNVNLVDPASGLVLWSERFDEATGDIFAMQDRIVREVATALEVGVLDTDAAARRTDPQAYMLY